MRVTVKIAVIGLGILFLSAVASARPCTQSMDVTLKGTITERVPADARDHAFSGIYLYVSDPSLDCSPIEVDANRDNKCNVDDRVGQLEGQLIKLENGAWCLSEKNSGAFPVDSRLFNCSKQGL
jgi:hypothetical protein